MPTHIAFFSFPHSTHIYPTLPIVSTLIRRGHRVTYVTSDRYASAVSELGAEVLPFSGIPDFVTLWDLWARGAPLGLEGGRLDFHATIRILSEVTAFYENNKPDLIIYDFMCYAGQIMSERLGIPAIQTSPTLAFDRETLARPLQQGEFREYFINDKSNIDEFLESYGIKKTGFVRHREKLHIFLYPKALQLDADAFDATCFYAGRCAAERSYRRTWQRKDLDRRPLVLVSSSSCFLQGPDYYKMCIDALSSLDLHVVLAIGDHNDAACLGTLPPHFEVLQGIPQMQVMPHAALLIFHGGMVTAAEALYHGVPLLLITHGNVECEAYAEHMAQLGVGIHLRKAETNVDSIRKSAVQIVRGTEIRSMVKEMSRIVRREAGGEDTANRIEEYIESVSTDHV